MLTRAIGVCCGLSLFYRSYLLDIGFIASILRRFWIPLGSSYLIVLLAVNGWFASPWLGLNIAEARLGELSFVPFYYHYFTTEAKALFSLLAVSASYLPIAILVWAFRRSPWVAASIGGFLALAVEAGKLFLDKAHPDPGNIILAIVSNWGMISLAAHLENLDIARANLPADTFARGVANPRSMGHAIYIKFAIVFSIVAYWVSYFPIFQVFVSLVLIGSAAIVWYRPALLLLIIPAAMPVFDLAPWSGRFFLDEFDALLFVGLAVAFVRVPPPSHVRSRIDVWFTVVVVLLALSFGISTALGLLPLQLPDQNSFNTYYSHYNALRIVKGMVWAYWIHLSLRRFSAHDIDVRKPFAWGMTLGLGITVAMIIWERVAFTGLWNFSADYRVTGPFSAIHTGGAYIECFLASATPFLLVRMLDRQPWYIRLAGLMLVLATTYAVMVTFSRNGYFAFAISVAIVLLASTAQAKQGLRKIAVLVVVVGAMLIVAVPIFVGEYAQSRVSHIDTDLDIRVAHWRDALDMRTPGLTTSLFGMGLGRFPETSFWRSVTSPRAGAYRLIKEADNTYLRMASGDSIYLDQFVAVENGQEYVLKLDVRSNQPQEKFAVPICEKWMLASYNCIWQSFDLGPEFGEWKHIEARLTAKQLAAGPWYSRRPVKLSLYYPTPNSKIDVDNVSLEDKRGTNLLRNGDFAGGIDYWFFTSDGHLQWHVKSLFYGVLFDQGWYGVTAMGIFMLLALVRGSTKVYERDFEAAAPVAALLAFVIVGVFDTLIDSPRFLLLFLLLAWLSACPTRLSVKSAK